MKELHLSCVFVLRVLQDCAYGSIIVSSIAFLFIAPSEPFIKMKTNSFLHAPFSLHDSSKHVGIS